MQAFVLLEVTRLRCHARHSYRPLATMSSENDSSLVLHVDDTGSETTEEFIVVEGEDVPEPDTLSTIDPLPRKTAKVVIGDSEDDDEEDEEVLQGEDGDILADYADDTEVCFFLALYCI
jgi:hypothetical protein